MDSWEDWQKQFRYGTIVIWPPDKIREVVNAQRELYDPTSQSICETHITITQPMIKPLNHEEWERITGLLKAYPSFEIEYGPLNSFLPYPCIWYEIKPAEKVLEIRNALHDTGFFNLELKHTEDFIPHMTITEGVSGPNVDEALLEQLQEESSQGSFLCKELMYIVPNAQFCFKATRALPLAAAGDIKGS